MAWRDIMTEIARRALERVEQCVEEGDGAKCATILLSCADAIYSPLKPVDAGLGEAKRLSARLSALLATYFVLRAEAMGKSELVKTVYEELRKGAGVDEEVVRELLKGLALESAHAPEPREAVVMTLKDYVEPEESRLPRRRRVPRRPEPSRELRRMLREVGRRDPILARMIADLLRSKVQGVA